MDMRNQPWTRHTAKEIDYIEKACELHGAARILDVGCGFGRHSIELARRQYDVVGGGFVRNSYLSSKRECWRFVCNF